MDLGELVGRAKAAVREGRPREALDWLARLEAARPADPVWPRRQAEIHRRLGDTEAELAALVRTSQCEVDDGRIVQAIATCKQILAIDPDHTETLDRIHLLYMVPQNESAPDAKAPADEIELTDSVAPSAPLDELLLTETLPGGRKVHFGDTSHSEATEIPIDPEGSVDRLDLSLDGPPLERPVRPTVQKDATCSAPPRPTRDDLLACALLGGLAPREIRELLQRVDMIEVAGGEAVFRQGDRAECLYVVVDGAVVPIAEDRSRVRMGVLEPGDFFGEIGLLSDQPRNATCEALVDTRLLAIDRPLVWSLLKQHPKVLRDLLRTLRERLVDRLIRTSPLFAAFASARRSDVARQFKMLEVRPYKVLLEQGLEAQGLFVVLSGKLEVVQQTPDGNKTIAELGHGDVFGEMSLLFESPATAKVVSHSKCWLVLLPRERFRRIARDNPGLVEYVRDIAQRRYRENWERTTGESRVRDAAGAGEAIEPFDERRSR